MGKPQTHPEPGHRVIERGIGSWVVVTASISEMYLKKPESHDAYLPDMETIQINQSRRLAHVGKYT